MDHHGSLIGKKLLYKHNEKLLIALTLLFTVSWTSYQQPKLLKVQADVNTWQAILNVIDLSTAEPKERISVREYILKQLNDTTINRK